MSEIKGGGPAFPLANSHVELAGTNWEHANGLTVRDYFAAKALAGMCADGQQTHRGDDVIAIDAYALADAMLRAREA